MSNINDNISEIRGVEEQRDEAFKKLGIYTLQDYITYFSRAYEDRRLIYSIAESPMDISVCVKTMVAAASVGSLVRCGMEFLKFPGGRSRHTGHYRFQPDPSENQLYPGVSYIFCGQVSETSRRRSSTNPIFEQERQQSTITGCVFPLYWLTAGVSQKICLV